MKALRTGLLLMAIAISATSLAQGDKGKTYNNGIGLRLGTENGVTYKHFFKETVAFEAMLTTGYRAFIITGLVEKHFPFRTADGFSFFLGAGAHIGSWKYVSYYRGRYYRDKYYFVRDDVYHGPSFGLDGILGLEYKFNAPVTLGVDIKPYFDIVYPGVSFIDGALSVRYTF
jgi:hypothetical protein